ncbi:MAG: glycosyltransferase family 39 protein [candidate division Zixibacteria bacterium]|nr:glycosyltransferase family 39 protein [candidate division Zixibacteria bacterium]
MNSVGRESGIRDFSLIAVVAFALAVRLGYLLYYSSLPEWGQLTVDNYYHLHWAQRIADGDLIGGTTYFRAPLYVWCLSLVITLLGDSLWILRLFGLIVGISSVAMTCLIARRLFDKKAAVIAGVIHALFPMAIYFDGELLLDPLFTLLIQIAVYRFLIWQDTQTGRNALLCGVILGLASITRPTALLFVPAAIGLILQGTGIWNSRIRHAALFALGAFLLIVPVTLRNIVVAGDPVLIASQGGINMYIGNNPHADGISAVLPQPFGHNWQMADVAYVAEIKEGRELRPGEVSDYWSRQAIKWMTDHPVDALALYLRKLYFSISNREISNNRDIDAFFGQVSLLRYNPLTFGVILALGAAGFLISLRTNPRAALLGWSILLFILANSTFFVNSRFRLPEIPLLIILSAGAIRWFITERGYGARTGHFAIALAVVMALLSYVPVLRFPQGANVAGLAARANFLYGQGDYRNSIAVGRQVLALDSTFPDANLTVGASYFRLGVGDSARHFFEREKALHPGRPKAYVNLASYYLINQDQARAFEQLNRALLLRPYDQMANTLLLRLVSADSGAAAQDVSATIDGALERTDSNLTLILDAAKVATERRMISKAESLLVTALEIAPPPVESDDAAFEPTYPFTPDRSNRLRAEAHFLLGYQYGVSGRFAESIVHSRAAVHREPDRAEAYVNLISGFVSMGNLRSADSVLQCALQKFPTDPQLRQIAERLHQ